MLSSLVMCCMTTPTNSRAKSDSIRSGMPNVQMMLWSSASATVVASLFGIGIANGKLVNGSITVSMYLLPDSVSSNGPTMSNAHSQNG